MSLSHEFDQWWVGFVMGVLGGYEILLDKGKTGRDYLGITGKVRRSGTIHEPYQTCDIRSFRGAAIRLH